MRVLPARPGRRSTGPHRPEGFGKPSRHSSPRRAEASRRSVKALAAVLRMAWRTALPCTMTFLMRLILWLLGLPIRVLVWALRRAYVAVRGYNVLTLRVEGS